MSVDADTKKALELDQERLNFKLRNAVYVGNHFEVQDLLNEGADPNYKGKDGKPQLIVASEKGFTRVVKLLLEYGANVNARDKAGKTAVQYAEAGRHHPVVHALKNPPTKISAPKKTVWSGISHPEPAKKPEINLSDKEIIAELRKEIRLLRNENQQLRNENQQLRRK